MVMASTVVMVMAAGAIVVLFLLLVEDRQILGIFQHEARGLPQSIGGQLPNAQGIQGRGPVQTLGDRGLFQDGFTAAELRHRQSHLMAQPVIHMGQLRPENGKLLVHIGILDVQVRAAAAKSLAQGPGRLEVRTTKGTVLA